MKVGEVQLVVLFSLTLTLWTQAGPQNNETNLLAFLLRLAGEIVFPGKILTRDNCMSLGHLKTWIKYLD